MKQDFSYVVPLTQGYVAVIDMAFAEIVMRYKWHVHFSKGKNRKIGQPYARGNVEGGKVYLHQFIWSLAKDQFDTSVKHVDHINHQTLDNRFSNLELVTHEENQKRRRNCITTTK